jgi:enoyl-CoA hydratase/carnithine racemase
MLADIALALDQAEKSAETVLRSKRLGIFSAGFDLSRMMR